MVDSSDLNMNSPQEVLAAKGTSPLNYPPGIPRLPQWTLPVMCFAPHLELLCSVMIPLEYQSSNQSLGP